MGMIKYCCMSGETINNSVDKTPDKINIQLNSTKASSSSRVDINHLLARARSEKSKQKKENIIFLGLVCSVVAVTGVIASL